jgi:hypothetical protein
VDALFTSGWLAKAARETSKRFKNLQSRTWHAESKGNPISNELQRPRAASQTVAIRQGVELPFAMEIPSVVTSAESMGLLNLVRRKPLPAIRYPVQAEVPKLQEADLAAVYYGQRMGGDFYDFLRVSPTRILFGLLDVAGQLEENHAIVNAAQKTFRGLGCELFDKEDFNAAENMTHLCLELNKTILEASEGVHASPAFVGCYDESLGTITYFNAGHPAGLVRDQTGIAELPATGLPLGLFSHTTMDVSTVALPPGAGLLLVSRGIVEAKCGGEEFGLEQVKAGLEDHSNGSAKELCMSILSRVQDFMCTPPVHNDVTALALVRSLAADSVGGNA